MASSAILAIRIVANADNAAREIRKTQRAVNKFSRDLDTMSGGGIGAFERMGASIAHVSAMMFAATAAAAPLIGVIGSIGLGVAGLGALAAPALGAMMLGLDGIKNAAKSVAPQFDALKSAVSSTFQQELVPAFQKLGALMDSITPAMQRIASSVSAVFSGVVDTITGPGRAALDSLLAGSALFVTSMGSGLNRLTQGMLQFGAAAASEASGLGAAFGEVLGTLGDALGRIPRELFTGFAQALQGFSNLLGPVVDLLAQLGVVIGPIVAQLFTSLGQAIQGMIPGLSVVAGSVGQALVQIFQTLAPVLPVVASAFGTLTQALLPLIPPLAQFIASAAVGLAGALVAVTPLIQGMATALGTVTGWISPLAPWIAGVALGIWALSGAVSAVTAIMGIWTTVTTVWSAVTKTAAAIQWAFNAAMSANPIGIVIIAVAALTAAVILAYNHCETFRNIVQAVAGAAVAAWNTVWQAISVVIDWIGNLLGRVGGVGGVFQGAMSIAAGAVNMLLGPIRAAIDLVSSLIGWISRIHFPSPPGWMRALFSAGDGMSFLPPEITRFLPPGYEQFDAAAPDITASAVSPFGSNPFSGTAFGMNVVNINIKVDGALDPVAVGRQIEGVVNKFSRTVGATNARRLG